MTNLELLMILAMIAREDVRRLDGDVVWANTRRALLRLVAEELDRDGRRE